jgi:hypothetical protein
MMKNFLFETFRGWLNWNKLKKNVYLLLVILTYVYHDAQFRECEVLQTTYGMH